MDFQLKMKVLKQTESLELNNRPLRIILKIIKI